MAITSIVSSTDMIGRYALKLPTDLTEFDKFVVDNEYQILVDLFGEGLYITYEANESLTAWTNLKNGVPSYTDIYGDTRKWLGLKKMFVRYHYAEWVKLESHSITGLIDEANENSTIISRTRVKNASDLGYNEFLREYYNAYDYMYANQSTYTDFNLFFKQKEKRGFIETVTVR